MITKESAGKQKQQSKDGGILIRGKKVAAGTRGNISKYFGANPKEVDGLSFQKKARKEWD